jgi:uncharacterized membrane protein YdjX (TVP38/TMEM64 family)
MKRRAIIFVVFLAGLAALWWFAREYATLPTLVEREEAVRGWLAARPVAGFAAGFGIYVGVSLVPGTTGKALIAGWLYGFWLGLLMVNLGLTVAAMLSFFACRYLLRDLIAARFGPRLARADAALAREGPRWLFFARTLHTPFWVTNNIMGATRISARGFWLSTQLGILPANIVFVYAGAAAPTLAELAEDGPWSLFTPEIGVALVAVTLLPLLLPRTVQWAARRWQGRRGTA